LVLNLDPLDELMNESSDRLPMGESEAAALGNPGFARANPIAAQRPDAAALFLLIPSV
jgi:hypothetical protein